VFTRLKHQKEKRGMDYFAGLDVSVKDTSVCIVDGTGKIVREVKVASEPQADIMQHDRDVRFVTIADATMSSQSHREWTCYPEATPCEFRSTMEIEARGATKRDAKPSTQRRSGLGSLLPHLRF